MLKIQISKADGFLIVRKDEQDLFEKVAAICNPKNNGLDVRLMEEKQSLN
jgi:hypothetical protein